MNIFAGFLAAAAPDDLIAFGPVAALGTDPVESGIFCNVELARMQIGSTTVRFEA